MSVASSGGGPTDPLDPSARARWAGARTIVVPLKLRPDQDYELSLNTEQFQNFANETFAEILLEARKYKLNLTIAHQYVEQMEEEVRKLGRSFGSHSVG